MNELITEQLHGKYKKFPPEHDFQEKRGFVLFTVGLKLIAGIQYVFVELSCLLVAQNLLFVSCCFFIHIIVKIAKENINRNSIMVSD